jgi:hypothetical protein
LWPFSRRTALLAGDPIPHVHVPSSPDILCSQGIEEGRPMSILTPNETKEVNLCYIGFTITESGLALIGAKPRTLTILRLLYTKSCFVYLDLNSSGAAGAILGGHF